VEINTQAGREVRPPPSDRHGRSVTTMNDARMPLGPAPPRVETIKDPTAGDYLRDLYGYVLVETAVHHLAHMGLHQLRSFLAANVGQFEDNPDPLIHVVVGSPDEVLDPAAEAVMTMQSSNALRLIQPGGPAIVRLAQQYIVGLYSHWEEVTRPGLAATLGMPKNEIRHDYFGDLRILRHRIVHASGVMSREACGRMKVLTWWAAGDNIDFFTAKHADEFTTLFPWRYLLDLAGLVALWNADGTPA
jgi:hypothetical protein